MNKPELFHKTVGILVKAYLNDTLRYSNCKACAVGNMVAGNMGIKLTKSNKGEIVSSDESYEGQWFNPFNEGCCGINGLRLHFINNTIRKQVKSTGYSIQELALIEYAFGEGGALYGSNYNGLMSVVDTLMEIHQATKEEAQQAKELFVLTDAG